MLITIHLIEITASLVDNWLKVNEKNVILNVYKVVIDVDNTG